jgi:ankyrin repeat protein
MRQDLVGAKISDEENNELSRLVVGCMGSRQPNQQALFDELFRTKIAPNARMVDGQPILSYALSCKSRPLTLSLLDQPAIKPMLPFVSLDKFVWSARVLERIMELDYPVREELAGNHQATAEAIRSEDPKVIGLLAKHGMPLEQIMIGGQVFSCLFHAANVSDYGNLLALLRAGSSPHMRDEEGDTFLHRMLKNGATKADPWLDEENIAKLRKLLRYCVQKKLSLDVANKKGQTPLHVAARYGYLNVALALLEHGADHTIRDNQNRTPLMRAKASGRDAFVQAISAHLARERILEVVRNSGIAAVRGP